MRVALHLPAVVAVLAAVSVSCAETKGAIAVSVSFPDGTPVEAAEVGILDEQRLAPALRSESEADGDAAVRKARTGADGRYSFTSLAPSHYSVNVHRADLIVPRCGEDRLFRKVELRGGVTRMDFVLERRAVIEQRSIEGHVVDARGEPVADVIVEAICGGLKEKGAFQAAADTTDDRGRFRLHGLVPADYYLAASRPRSLPPRRRPSGLVAPLRPTYRDHTVLYPGVTHPEAAKVLTVSAAGDVTGVRVTIEDAQAAAISGIVRRPDGAPVAGSYVKLERPEFSYGSSGTGMHARPDGSFSFAHLYPGEYIVQADSPSGERPRKTVRSRLVLNGDDAEAVLELK